MYLASDKSPRLAVSAQRCCALTARPAVLCFTIGAQQRCAPTARPAVRLDELARELCANRETIWCRAVL